MLGRGWGGKTIILMLKGLVSKTKNCRIGAIKLRFNESLLTTPSPSLKRRGEKEKTP
jgi:hypothetical protein